MADYDVTTWSPDTLTNASETTSATLNNATLSGTLTVTGATALSSTLTVTGATQLNSTLTVGVNDTGYDVKFYGDADGQYLLWDASVDDLIASDNSMIRVGDSGDGRFYHDGTDTYLSNHNGDFNIHAFTGAVNIGTNGASTIPINIGHSASETTIGDNLTVNGTLDASSTSTLTGLVTASAGVKLGNNILYASDGGSTITLDTSDNVAIGNNLKVGGNVIQASDGGSTITMDTSDNVTIAGNLTAGVLIAKTYKQETFFGYNLASVAALTSGTEYYISLGGQDINSTVMSNSPLAQNVETATSDFTITRFAINFYNAQSNVTSIEVRLKKYDGSGNIDSAGEWASVGTAATVQGSGTLNADTRVVQTPTDWVIEKNEIWGLTIEYTLSSGTVTDNLISGAVLMLQDWSDIIANT
tara:strand:- start:102 stop:1346 length:1245 start_codon:yes stop_codon:yes gene_type:complete